MTDRDLKRHVEQALDWEPIVDSAEIDVSVDAGVVTLRGDVGSSAAKATAERVVLGVYGVKAVANDLTMRLVTGYERNDTDIAQDVVTALTCNTVIPPNRVTAAVSNGWVTLNGTLDWQYQTAAAARAVRDCAGVKGVTSRITLKPHVCAGDVQNKIEAAFKCSAELDARCVHVTATNGTVILSGQVRSSAERQEAERVAWAAPGVSQVDDRITVVP